jgi:hypothetical protein
MKSKGLALKSTQEVTENGAKRCQKSGQSRQGTFKLNNQEESRAHRVRMR